MKAIMTVTGLDHTGIIAGVSAALARQEVNILNVSQTLMDQYFTMIMQLEFDESRLELADVQTQMQEVAREQALEIRVQSEAIFNAMNRLWSGSDSP